MGPRFFSMAASKGLNFFKGATREKRVSEHVTVNPSWPSERILGYFLPKYFVGGHSDLSKEKFISKTFSKNLLGRKKWETNGVDIKQRYIVNGL